MQSSLYFKIFAGTSPTIAYAGTSFVTTAPVVYYIFLLISFFVNKDFCIMIKNNEFYVRIRYIPYQKYIMGLLIYKVCSVFLQSYNKHYKNCYSTTFDDHDTSHKTELQTWCYF